MKDFIEIANNYIEGVLSRDIPACEYVRQACQRQKDDLENPPDGYVFSEARAIHPCRFVEHLPHIKGEWRGRPIELHPAQIFIITTVFGWIDSNGYRRFKTAYIELPRKNAKALSLETEIPTPHGLKKLADIHTGDLVYGSDGQSCVVLGESPIYTDHTCYEMEFSNGQAVIADAGHKWVTQCRRDRDNTRKVAEKIYTTEQIANSLICRDEHNHKIVISEPIQNADRQYEVDPYVLGVWLGDGNKSGPRVTICNTDTSILDEIRKSEVVRSSKAATTGASRFSIGTKVDNPLRARLKKLDLLHNKHIPEQYFLGSHEQRLQLLRGLMDTDGNITKSGECCFNNSNKRLALDVKSLVCSLGYKATMVIREAKIYKKSYGDTYRVSFFADDRYRVSTLERKYSRQIKFNPQSTRRNKRSIVRCDRIDSVPVKCLSVDSPDNTFLITRDYVKTHNSTLSSGLSLYCMLADGEGGPEIYSAATTRDQARIVFNDAAAMVRESKDLRDAFNVQVGGKTINNNIFSLSNGSVFKPLSRDQGGNLDGLNVHFAAIDELHAHKTRDVFDVIETATGARRQPLLWLITTAGFNRAGICYEQRAYTIKVLSKVHDDPEYFGAIYTIDEGDDWTRPEAWEKANPLWGVSVNPEDIARKARKAIETPSATNNFLTKHLNVWVNASTAWMNMQRWQACGDPTIRIEDYRDWDCWLGLDLASKLDIAAKIYIFRRDDDYRLFSTFWLPEETVMNSANSQYSGWVREGYLLETDGATIDYNAIQESIINDFKELNIQECCFDPFQATQMAGTLIDEGLTMVEIRPTILNFSEPMKTLEELIINGRLKHDASPAMEWMISNVVCKRDAKDNIYPNKEFPENKIDGPVAAIMALSRAIVAECNTFDSIYNYGEL